MMERKQQHRRPGHGGRFQTGAVFLEYLSVTTFISILVWIAFIEGGSAGGFSFPSVFEAAQLERDAYLHVVGEDLGTNSGDDDR